jgi:uncharacterized membrane protein
MSTYLIVKWLHIVSSVLMVGTGFGTAFYLFFANRSGKLPAIAVVSALVVRADTWFTAPAVLFQPLSGIWLAQQGGWPLDSGWLFAALLLYALAGACWLPVVWLQLKMRDMAQVVGSGPLPVRYWRYARSWERLGYPAFIAMLLVFFLMAAKPSF